MIRTWIRAGLVASGVVALGVAGALLFAPEVVAPVLHPESIDRRLTGTAGVAALVGGLVLGSAVGLWKGVTASPRTDSSAMDRPMDRTGVTEQVAGSSFDEALQVAVETGDREARETVQSELQDVAIRTVATVDGVDTGTARREVLDGTWTEDRVVGSFLGDETAPDPPLRWRLYAWLYPGRSFEQSVERTVSALETDTRE